MMIFDDVTQIVVMTDDRRSRFGIKPVISLCNFIFKDVFNRH